MIVSKRVALLLLTLLLMCLIVVSQQAQAQDNPAVAPPTNTPRLRTPTLAVPPGTSTNTLVPSRTPTNTSTPPPSKVPTRTRTLPPTLVIMGTYQTPELTPFTAIPPAFATPVSSGHDVVTILIIGSDNSRLAEVSNTDTLIVVRVDRTANTVTMMHLARDTLVYAPNHTMMKLNTVMMIGNQDGPGKGAQLLKDTVLYNFGIKVDFYAHVNFPGFQHIIAKLGGLDVAVDCAIQGHRLKSYTLDQSVAANYELYTLNVGYQHLDAYMALWYVRSRGSSSDIDRGRRQMDVLRAIWRQGKAQGLINQFATLWPDLQEIVETDLTLPDVLGLVPYAINLDPANIQSLNVDLNTGYTIWYTADKGQYSLLMNRDVWKTAINNFTLPLPANRFGGEDPTVEIGASPRLKGYDLTAADSIAWEGFDSTILPSDKVAYRTNTTIIDYTGNAKPDSLATLVKVLRVGKGQVLSQPDPNRTVDFRVEMGKDYSQCIYTLPEEYQDTPVPGQ